jgi:hypothetical protein
MIQAPALGHGPRHRTVGGCTAGKAIPRPFLSLDAHLARGPSLRPGCVVPAIHATYGPRRLPLGAPPFRRVAAYRFRRYRAPRDGSPRPHHAGAETDLSCSVAGYPTVPIPIPRRVHRRCASKLFAPSIAFAHLRRARLPHLSCNAGEPDEAAGFLIVRTGWLLAPQGGFVVALRRSGLPFRRPPATGLLGHYPGRTLTGKSTTASPGHTEDRLNDDLGGRLHNAVANSRDRERTKLLLAGLRDEHPARGKRTPAPVLQIRGQLVKQPGNPVALNVGDGLFVDAGRATIGAHQLPRPLQDVPAVDLVIERVEPSSGIGLGRPVQRPLQFSD